MIATASRKERLNMSAAGGTGYSIPAYTVSTNRTFVLTDVMFETNDGGEGLKLMDTASQATPTAGQEKIVFYSNPVRITNMTNGPEFGTAVSGVLVGNRALPTYSLYGCMSVKTYYPEPSLVGTSAKDQYIAM